MINNIEKSEQPDPEDVMAAVVSFNDAAIITGLFKRLGWTYSIEIEETISLARQNANLSIKFKAMKHLRELLREAAETSGYLANVSQSTPNAQGGVTTFHAKRIANILNPTKKIESSIKEPNNEESEEPRTKSGPNRESNRQQGKSETENTELLRELPGSTSDSRCPDCPGDGGLGFSEPADGGETSGNEQSAGDNIKTGTSEEPREIIGDGEKDNPCIQTRPPTCDRDLFPGISTSAESR
jgi:hypothetical protein